MKLTLTTPSADLRGASFDGAMLWHAKFDEADISPLALAGGAIREFSFKGAQFAPGCFQNSRRGPFPSNEVGWV